MRILTVFKRLIDRFFFFACRSMLKKNRKRESVLLIVRTDGVGDLTYFSRYLKALRRHDDGRRMVLCCRSESSELAEYIPSIDRVIGFDSVRCRRNYVYRFRLICALRALGPSTALYASFHREHIGDELTVLSGAQETVAMSGNDECINPRMLKRNNRTYSRIVDIPDHIPEGQKYGLLLDALGVSSEGREADVSFRLPEDQRTLARSYVEKIIADGKYIVVAPGGSASIRRWSRENYRTLLLALVRSFGMRVLLVGDRKERALLESLAGALPEMATACWNEPIRNVLALVASAKLLIGNDSGLLHIAANAKTPAVCILGGGHFRRYFPYGSVTVVNHAMECYECNWRCIHPAPYCMTEIRVDDVMRSVRSLFQDVQR